MPFVFLHGVNNTASTWQPVRRVLDALGIESLAFDFPVEDDIDRLASAVLAELPKSRKCVLVGHSFGGMVALAMLEQQRQRIEGLVLVNSSCGEDSDEARAARMQRVSRALAGEYLELANAASGRAYHPRNQNRSDLMLARQKEIEAYGSRAYVAHQLAMASRRDRTVLLAEFEGAKLVISADADVVIPTDKQRLMADAVGAPWICIEGGGHMLPAECPDELARVLADWWRDLPKGNEV